MTDKKNSQPNTKPDEDALTEELHAAFEKDEEFDEKLSDEQLAALEEQAAKIAEQAEKISSEKPEPWVSEDAFSNLFDRLGSAAGQAMKIARRTTDTSYKVGKALVKSQDQLKVMLAAGQSLKDLREVAGLTANELSDAINLRDKSLIEAVENGTATLSFELILRLSALLARNDPIPFILKYSRTYSPETWKLLHDWGAGRLPLQYQREREFINIYRSKDQARQLSDEGFAHVLAFSREAFNTALHFVEEQERKTREISESPEKSEPAKGSEKRRSRKKSSD